MVDLKDVAIADIDSRDQTFQYRLTTNVHELRRSLDADGQAEPIDLAGSAPYRIIDGFRRVEAATSLGWRSIRAFVHAAITERDAHRIAFVKNVVRKNLTPLDKARAIQLAETRGHPLSEIASEFGLSEKQVRRYRALLEIPARLQELVDQGVVDMLRAKILADAAVADVDSWLDRLQQNRWSARELRDELRRSVGRKSPGRPRVFMRRDTNAIRVYPFTIRKDAPAEERERLIATLQEALDFLGATQRLQPFGGREASA